MTDSQRSIHQYMRHYQYHFKKPPTIREICDEFKFTSTNSGMCYVRALMRENMVCEVGKPRDSRRYFALPRPAKRQKDRN